MLCSYPFVPDSTLLGTLHPILKGFWYLHKKLFPVPNQSSPIFSRVLIALFDVVTVPFDQVPVCPFHWCDAGWAINRRTKEWNWTESIGFSRSCNQRWPRTPNYWLAWATQSMSVDENASTSASIPSLEPMLFRLGNGLMCGLFLYHRVGWPFFGRLFESPTYNSLWSSFSREEFLEKSTHSEGFVKAK
jgi:hypothetical protein